MADFLTEKAFFACEGSPLKKFSANANQSAVRLGGASVLTIKSVLYAKSPIQCDKMATATNGVQMFCCQMLSPWQGGFNGAHTVNGAPLLTTGSCRRCLVFGCKIGILGSDPKNPGLFANALDIGGNGGASSQKNAQEAEKDAAQDTSGRESGSPRERNDQGANNGKAAGNSTNPEGQKLISPGASQEDGDTGEKKEEKFFYACGKCTRSDCDIKEKFLLEYREKRFSEMDWENLPLTVNNNSTTLRDRYLKHYSARGFDKIFGADLPASEGEYDPAEATLADRAYGEAEKKLRENPEQWKYQGHHLVSGRQVFAKLPDLVRMAVACDYDINHHRNCIMLTSNVDDYGVLARGMKHFGDGAEKEEEAKATQAYTVMRKTGIQWHVGHHYYSFDEEEAEKIRNELNRRHLSGISAGGGEAAATGNALAEIACYKDMLEDLLKSMMNILVGDAGGERHKPVCPLEFIGSMNNISAAIRDKLAAFYHNYQNSHPWYVSRASYLFAFGLPQKFRLITVRVRENGFLMEKFKLSRGMNGEKDAHMDGAPLFYDPSSDPPGKCVRFCSNIEHFLFFGNCDAQMLPFNFDKDHPEASFCRKANHGNFNSLGYLEANLEEMLAWVGASMDGEPKPVAQRTRERMAQLKNRNGAQS